MSLVIVSILLGLALPSFVDFIHQIRLATVTHELHSAINLTRMEALKRNGSADLVAIDGSWKNGWIIKSPDNERIQWHEPLNNDLQISGKFTDGAQHIGYNGTGRSRTKSSTGSPQSGHIQISLGKNSRLIIVNFLGRVRVCNPALDHSCTIDQPE